MGEVVEFKKRTSRRNPVQPAANNAPALDPTAHKMLTFFTNVHVLFQQLGLGDAELDDFKKRLDNEIDEMKLASPSRYARDGEFFRNRIEVRIKLVKELRKQCEAELLEDKKRSENKIILS